MKNMRQMYLGETHFKSYDATDSLNPSRIFLYNYECFPNIIGLNPSEDKRRCVDGLTFKFDIEKVIEFLTDNEYNMDYTIKTTNGMRDFMFKDCELNRIEDVDEKHELRNKRIVINIPNIHCVIHSRQEIIFDTNHQQIKTDYIELYYEKYEYINTLIKKIWEIAYTEIETEKTNLYAIKQTMEGFDLTPQVIKKSEVNIQANYNDDFQEANKVIDDFIHSDNEHGIVILNGAMGTGKTHYIRYLINNNPNVKFILGTKNIAEHIAEPSFIEFLSKNQNSVLILEDCENIVRKRSMNESSAVTNLLNVGDGLLADSLKIKIIITFNTDLKNIDSALQRKGRLRYQYTFENLDARKSEKLLKSLGFKPNRVTTPMSLADIYNYGNNNNVKANEAVIGYN